MYFHISKCSHSLVDCKGLKPISHIFYFSQLNKLIPLLQHSFILSVKVHDSNVELNCFSVRKKYIILPKDPTVEGKLDLAALVFLLKERHVVSMSNIIKYKPKLSLFVILLIFGSSVYKLFHHLQIAKHSADVGVGCYVDSVSYSGVVDLGEQEYVCAGQGLSEDVSTCFAMLSDHLLHCLQTLLQPMSGPLLPTASVVFLNFL
jgi:hypothetical protein